MEQTEKNNEQNEKLEQLATLYEVGLTLDATIDLNKRIYMVLKAIGRALKSQVALYLFDETEKVLVLESTNREISPQQIIKIPLGQGIVGQVAQDGKTISETGTVICVPLKLRGKIIGVIECNDRKDETLYDMDDQRLLNAIVNQVSIAVENTHLFESVINEKKKLESIIQSIGEGLFITDSERKILLWNPFAENITGYSKDEIRGKYCYDVLMETDEQGKKLCDSECPMSQCFSAHKSVYWSLQPCRYIQKKNGQKVPISGTAAPILDLHGNLLGGIVVFVDVTREKEIDQMKTELVSMVSHELRTPLTAIMLLIDLLSKYKSKISEEQEMQYLQTMHNEGERLIRLINNFLDISKIESGKIELNVEKISVNSILTLTIENLKPTTNKHKFITKFSSNFPHIIADKDKVEQLITNLISNAIKYSPDGGDIIITGKEEKEFVQMSVEDNGIGIGREDIHKIFGKFQRIHSTISQKAKGSGLGLAICKGIVEAHGGKIWVESPINEVQKTGTRFVFTLHK